MGDCFLQDETFRIFEDERVVGQLIEPAVHGVGPSTAVKLIDYNTGMSSQECGTSEESVFGSSLEMVSRRGLKISSELGQIHPSIVIPS